MIVGILCCVRFRLPAERHHVGCDVVKIIAITDNVPSDSKEPAKCVGFNLLTVSPFQEFLASSEDFEAFS